MKRRISRCGVFLWVEQLFMFRYKQNLYLLMNTTKNYETLSVALNDLIKRGYKVDFNLLKENDEGKAAWDEFIGRQFNIVEMHRFDGMTNVDDESVLYVIETKNGIKGTLVDAYGVHADPAITDIIKGMKFDR